jgi:hypothetical protein
VPMIERLVADRRLDAVAADPRQRAARLPIVAPSPCRNLQRLEVAITCRARLALPRKKSTLAERARGVRRSEQSLSETGGEIAANAMMSAMELSPQPLIAVRDVEASSRFYQHLLGCESGP